MKKKKEYPSPSPSDDLHSSNGTSIKSLTRHHVHDEACHSTGPQKTPPSKPYSQSRRRRTRTQHPPHTAVDVGRAQVVGTAGIPPLPPCTTGGLGLSSIAFGFGRRVWTRTGGEGEGGRRGHPVWSGGVAVVPHCPRVLFRRGPSIQTRG